jgi:prepilin-type N-terminal cleavage/methylation domain-containing protein
MYKNKGHRKKMMNKIGKKLGYKDGGFTIIEVMIVLAVAGLIMAIVLVAIPQLQRSQRNSARRDIMSRIKTEIDSYAGNNNGRVPNDATTLAAVNTRYLTGVNIEDPSTGNSLFPSWRDDTTNTPAVGASNYAINASCNGEALIGGSARNYAFWTQLEGGAIYCIDNR